MTDLLKIEDLSAGYGEAVVLNHVSLSLGEGQTLALLGRNGTGKTTLINTLAGATRQHGGRIFLGGQVLHKMPSHERAAVGIGWVPQERNIFKSLTVHENLTAVARPARAGRASSPWTPERVYELFPRLAERKTNLGTQLSGGEQQMLAVGRALVLNPTLLLLDEPTAGMSPEETLVMMDLIRTLANERTVILVEHKMKLIMGLCKRIIVLHHGEFLAEGTPEEIQNNAEVRRVYLGQG